ncbi:mechanosensitive ion channel [Sporosarcina jiandibaonis]|uniref:mechanosensitive ion channel n=1 Tax=Sporosarcina jiandibaonis TaxID=2715535 RepID=UPI0015567B52|nr:mechanosensitive ion channel [Sporosarcina jiandibaonis]
MSDFTIQGFLSWLPDLLIGLLILLVGFIVAKIIEGAVYKLLRKFRMNERLGTTESKWNIEKIISKVIFWGIMLLALIMFLNVMNMSLIATPFVSIYSGFAGAILGILKAALILFIAWILALVVKKFILMAGGKLNLNKYIVKAGVSAEEANKSKWIESAANIAFYLILLLFMPAVLHALGLSGVSGPFEGLLQGFLNFIPKLVGAAIIFAVGFIVAKIIRVILTKFLESIGTDRFANKLKLSSFIKGTSLSKLVGTIAFILIMIPVTISSLEALDLRGISEPAIGMLHDIVGMIPKIVIAVLLVLVGLLLAKWIRGVVVSLLENLGVNSLFGKMGVRSVKPSMPSLAEIIGAIVQVVVVLLFVVEALQVVNLHFMVTLATGIFAYLPMVLAAVVILAVGFWLANLAERFVGSVMRKPSGAPHVLRYVAKYAILAFAFFMALSQLGIAPAIINAAFILILGGVALAFGLAFGLGGREHASRYLSEMESSLSGAEVSKAKWEKEKAEVKNEVEDVINKAEVDPNKSTPGQDKSYNEPKPGERYPFEGEGNDDPLVP